MIGVEGSGVASKFTYDGVEAGALYIYSICIHRGPGIENTIWRAQVYPKAIRSRTHEFTLIQLPGFASFTGFIISSMIRRSFLLSPSFFSAPF